MPGIDPPSHSASLPSWWKSVLVAMIAGILAFMIWTLPNWGEFWSNVLQFPDLWHIPENRRIIISLIIKVTSPLLLMGIIGVILWMYSLLQPSQDEEGTDIARVEPVHSDERPIGTRIHHTTSPAMPAQQLQIQGGTSFYQSST